MGQRPGSVTVVGALIFLSAFLNLLIGAYQVFFALGSGRIRTSYGAVPDGYWIIGGLLSIALGLMYIWLARAVMAGAQGAPQLVTILVIINVFFLLLSLPYGWVPLIANVIVGILINTGSAKAWFGRRYAGAP